LAVTAGRYLEQTALSLRPASVVLADASLRFFCRYLVEEHPKTTSFTAVGRAEIEGYKANLARRITPQGRLVSPDYRRQRLGMLRTFFDRIIEWDWDDAPPRCPIFASDLPKPDEPLPPQALSPGSIRRLHSVDDLALIVGRQSGKIR